MTAQAPPPASVPPLTSGPRTSVPVAQPSRQSKRGAKREMRRLKIEPPSEGQLEQLLIQWKKAKDSFEECKEAESDLKAQIKAWILSIMPPEQLPDAFDITGDPLGRYEAMSMTLKGGMRVDTEAMREAGVYEQFAKPTAPSWELRPATQGRH